MKTFAAFALLGAFALGQTKTSPQDAVISSCVVLAASEPASGIATWSREGRSRKHTLTYLAGGYPLGFHFRSSVKDKDVDKIKAKGGRVLILDPHYTREDLEKAKQTCEKPAM